MIKKKKKKKNEKQQQKKEKKLMLLLILLLLLLLMMMMMMMRGMMKAKWNEEPLRVSLQVAFHRELPNYTASRVTKRASTNTTIHIKHHQASSASWKHPFRTAVVVHTAHLQKLSRREGDGKPHSHDNRALNTTSARKDEAFIGLQQHRFHHAKSVGTGDGLLDDKGDLAISTSKLATSQTTLDTWLIIWSPSSHSTSEEHLESMRYLSKPRFTVQLLLYHSKRACPSASTSTSFCFPILFKCRITSLVRSLCGVVSKVTFMQWTKSYHVWLVEAILDAVAHDGRTLQAGEVPETWRCTQHGCSGRDRWTGLLLNVIQLDDHIVLSLLLFQCHEMTLSRIVSNWCAQSHRSHASGWRGQYSSSSHRSIDKAIGVCYMSLGVHVSSAFMAPGLNSSSGFGLGTRNKRAYLLPNGRPDHSEVVFHDSMKGTHPTVIPTEKATLKLNLSDAKRHETLYDRPHLYTPLSPPLPPPLLFPNKICQRLSLRDYAGIHVG
ncbi:hypothetical protein TcWFU_005481 [Taenia crassiceps]|uniref:Uncharacterized protein n=1 Tax=Taenia crassiceps TaxID=6207 RepID=A0ABR4Q3Q4_9CEST